MRRAMFFCFMFLMASASGSSYAAVPKVLRSGTRPFFATFSFGPAINVVDHVDQFKIIQDFGFHFSGNSSGPALGASLAESFGRNWFTLQIGPKFWWDIQPIDGVGFYLAPMAQLGYALSTSSNPRSGPFNGLGRTEHFMNIQIGFEGKLILGDRGMVLFRIFTLDMFAGESFAMRYDLMFGGGVTF